MLPGGGRGAAAAPRPPAPDHRGRARGTRSGPWPTWTSRTRSARSARGSHRGRRPGAPTAAPGSGRTSWRRRRPGAGFRSARAWRARELVRRSRRGSTPRPQSGEVVGEVGRAVPGAGGLALVAQVQVVDVVLGEQPEGVVVLGDLLTGGQAEECVGGRPALVGEVLPGVGVQLAA